MIYNPLFFPFVSHARDPPVWSSYKECEDIPKILLAHISLLSYIFFGPIFSATASAGNATCVGNYSVYMGT